MPQSCFVIMPIGTQTHGSVEVTAEEFKARYTDLIREALLKARGSLEVTRADDVVAPGAITGDVLTRLMYSDYVLADITYPNANVFYELGIRHACRGGTILIRDEAGPRLPFDVSELRHTVYRYTPTGLKELAENLKRQLGWIDKNPGVPDNRFLEIARFTRFNFPTYDRTLFPEPIERAIVEQLHSRQFFKSNVTFAIDVRSVAAECLEMQTELTYDVTNRTDQDQFWDMQYKVRDAGPGVVEARFRGESLDPNLKDHRYGRGVNIRRLVRSGETATVYFRAIEEFDHSDSELYTSYFPATDLRLSVTNSFPEVSFDFEFLYFDEVWPTTRNGDRVEVFIDRGILPHQGIRLNWGGVGK